MTKPRKVHLLRNTLIATAALVLTSAHANASSDDSAVYPNIPDELQEHSILKKRGMGACKEMTGDVLLTVIFVSDSSSDWTEEDRETAKATINNSSLKLMEEAAAYGAELELSQLYLEATTSAVLSFDDSSPWAETAVASTGYDLATISETICSQYNVDEAPIILFINRTGRSFAVSHNVPDEAEYVVLYEKHADFRHEVHHLFGARDYYLYDLYEASANQHFPNSVMLTSGDTVVDSLTAYLIGWTDDPEEDGLAFLTETIGLTQEQMSEELARNTYTGYVEQWDMDDGLYTGNLADGIRQGYGRMDYNDGAFYEGEWNYGASHGYGTYVWANGDSYTGEFSNGLCHGYGTFAWANGDSYTGEFSNGTKNGYGILWSENGNRYTGEFSDGNYHGSGTFVWANGSRYTGEFSNGDRTGYGTIWLANGESYTGEFNNGKCHGYGTYTWPDGTSQSGNWENGVFID